MSETPDSLETLPAAPEQTVATTRGVCRHLVARGYAVLTTEPETGKRFGTVLKSPDAVAPGTRLQATLAGGTLAVIAEGPVDPSEP